MSPSPPTLDVSVLLRPAPAYTASRYRNVYAHHSRLRPWVAKVKVMGRLRRLGAARTEYQAAQIVARYFYDRYGANWARVVRNGVPRGTPWAVWYSPGRRCWHLAVWELGRRTEVVRFRRDGRPGRTLEVFRSRREAVGYVRQWVRRRYGMFADVVLGR